MRAIKAMPVTLGGTDTKEDPQKTVAAQMAERPLSILKLPKASQFLIYIIVLSFT